MRLSQPRSNTLATRGTITVPLLSAGDWRYSSTGSVGSAKVRRSLSPPIGAPQRRAPLARSGSIIWKPSTLLPPDAGTPRHLWRKPQENEVQEKDGTAARRDDTLCKMEWASEQFQHESVQEQDATTFSVVSIRPTSTSRMRSHERDPAPAAKDQDLPSSKATPGEGGTLAAKRPTGTNNSEKKIAEARRESSITKNIISPRCATGERARDSALPPPGFEHYEQMISQRDTKVDDADKSFAAMFPASPNSAGESMRLQEDLDKARREAAQQRATVARLKNKQDVDIKELRKLHEEVVRESMAQKERVQQLQETIRIKDQLLVQWQRSHGELECQLETNTATISQLELSHAADREQHSKQAEGFHKTVLDHSRQQDALRKDRDSLAAQLHELQSMFRANEGVVEKLQVGLNEKDHARERLQKELEVAQSQATTLRQEIVMLHQREQEHQASMRHEFESRRQLELSLKDVQESKSRLESEWSLKLQGVERASADAWQALDMQNKRNTEIREAHDRTLEDLRAELSQATFRCGTVNRELEDMTVRHRQLQDTHDGLQEQLRQSRAECRKLSERCVSMEASQTEQAAMLQEQQAKLVTAGQEADSAKKDYATLLEAGSVKDHALRAELAEARRRAAANERESDDLLARERREHETVCAALRGEIYSLREAAAGSTSVLDQCEQERDAAEEMLRAVETELEASKTRELEALARVDEMMQLNVEETSGLRVRALEMSTALREAEESRLNAAQTSNALRAQLQDEERAWKSKWWDRERQWRGKLEAQRHVFLTASRHTQSILQLIGALHTDVGQLKAVVEQGAHHGTGLQNTARASAGKESPGTLEHAAHELDLLKAHASQELSSLKAHLADFERRVETYEAEIKAQAQRCRDTAEELGQARVGLAANGESPAIRRRRLSQQREMEQEVESLRDQKRELETSLAIERAARAAVEQANVSLNRSNTSARTPRQVPSDTRGVSPGDTRHQVGPDVSYDGGVGGWRSASDAQMAQALEDEDGQMLM